MIVLWCFFGSMLCWVSGKNLLSVIWCILLWCRVIFWVLLSNFELLLSRVIFICFGVFVESRFFFVWWVCWISLDKFVVLSFLFWLKWCFVICVKVRLMLLLLSIKWLLMLIWLSCKVVCVLNCVVIRFKFVVFLLILYIRISGDVCKILLVWVWWWWC